MARCNLEGVTVLFQKPSRNHCLRNPKVCCLPCSGNPILNGQNPIPLDTLSLSSPSFLYPSLHQCPLSTFFASYFRTPVLYATFLHISSSPYSLRHKHVTFLQQAMACRTTQCKVGLHTAGHMCMARSAHSCYFVWLIDGKGYQDWKIRIPNWNLDYFIYGITFNSFKY